MKINHHKTGWQKKSFKIFVSAKSKKADYKKANKLEVIFFRRDTKQTNKRHDVFINSWGAHLYPIIK